MFTAVSENLHWPIARVDITSNTGNLVAAIAAEQLESTEVTVSLDKLQRWNERIDAVLAVVSDGVLVLDTLGTVVYMNAVAAALLVPNAESRFIGRPVRELLANYQLYDEAGLPLPTDATSSIGPWQDGQATTATVRLRAGDIEAWLCIRRAPIHDEAQRVAAVVMVLRDITELKQNEERLRLLADTDAMVSRTLDRQRSLAGLATLLAERLDGMCRIAVAELEQSVIITAASGAPLTLRLGPTGPLMREIDTAQILNAEPAKGRLRELVDELSCGGRRTVIAAPLATRDQWHGLLVVGAAALTPAHVPLLAQVAERAAIAIENSLLYEQTQRAAEAQAQLLDETQRRGRQLALAADVAVALARQAPLDEVLGRCAESIKLHLDVDTVRIWSAAGSDTLELRVSAGAAPAESELRFEPGSDLIGRAAAELRPVRDERQAAYPLLVGRRCIGVLGIVGGPPLVLDTFEALVTIADQIALGIDRRRAEDERSELLARVQDSDRRKDEFLAMLAHELRNPLAPILTAVELITTEKATDAAGQWRIIDRQVRHLVRLLDDLLDVSRLTHGKIELRREPLDLGAVVTQALEAARPALQRRHHRLGATLPKEAVFVLGDSIRLEQVFTNLLANAACYTAPGGHVWVEFDRADDGIAVRIRDDGIGVAPDMLERVFDLFVQGERSLDRPHGGLGIGLTLVKCIVEMHGGRATLASAGVGQGCEATVWLPLSRPPEVAPPPRREPAATDALANRRILIVDDNADAASCFAEALTLFGCTVEIANDGEQGLALAGAHLPHLVLLDIGLPGLDGYEVARRLRADPQTSGCGIIAVSGYAEAKDRERSRQAGCDEHLAKPVELEVLIRCLCELDRQPNH